jgi:HEPN domain-containing protein
MGDAKCERVQAWLLKAQTDLLSARRLAAGDDPLYETAVYHCQQAAEKAVKAYLVFNDRRSRKTHDVEDLVKMAEQCDARFSAWHEAAKLVTPYAQAFRYPADEPHAEPDQHAYVAAEQAAAGLFGFVCSLLPAQTQPPKFPDTRCQ